MKMKFEVEEGGSILQFSELPVGMCGRSETAQKVPLP
jgi:hypothetical protein